MRACVDSHVPYTPDDGESYIPRTLDIGQASTEYDPFVFEQEGRLQLHPTFNITRFIEFIDEELRGGGGRFYRVDDTEELLGGRDYILTTPRSHGGAGDAFIESTTPRSYSGTLL